MRLSTSTNTVLYQRKYVLVLTDKRRRDHVELVNKLDRALTPAEQLRCKRQILINHGRGGLGSASLEEINRLFAELPGASFELEDEAMIPLEGKPTGWGWW